jgi:hypothetical protein
MWGLCQHTEGVSFSFMSSNVMMDQILVSLEVGLLNLKARTTIEHRTSRIACGCQIGYITVWCMWGRMPMWGPVLYFVGLRPL